MLPERFSYSYMTTKRGEHAKYRPKCLFGLFGEVHGERDASSGRVQRVAPGVHH